MQPNASNADKPTGEQSSDPTAPRSERAGDLDVDAKTTDELESLAEWYFERHAQARDAARANGPTEDTWDDHMRECMATLRAIDEELQRRQRDADEEGGETDENAGAIVTDGGTAPQETTIVGRFRAEFDAERGSDHVDDGVSAAATLTSSDDLAVLVDTGRVRSVGVTDLADYQQTSPPIDVDVSETASDRERDGNVQLCAVDHDNGTAHYQRALVDRVATVLGLCREELVCSAWSGAAGAVCLLRIDVPGSSWAVVLAPYIVGGDDSPGQEQATDRGHGVATDGGTVPQESGHGGDCDSHGDAQQPAYDHDHDRTPDLEDHYWKLRNYVQMVTSGETNALLLEAGPGIGKSYQIGQTLDADVGADGWHKISGHCTPVELFHQLFEVSAGKVLFLDDIEGLIDNKSALALLKQATWSETDERHVEWRSTSDVIEVPEKFRFKGRVIMCFNEVPSDKLFDSLEDRCLTYRIHFTHDERLSLLREVAKAPHKGLTFDERMAVVGWIGANSTPADDVNLRLMFHIFDMRDFNPERWQELAVEQLDADEEAMLVRDLVATHDTIKAASDAYERETGKSARTFFRKKQAIVDNAGREE